MGAMAERSFSYFVRSVWLFDCLANSTKDNAYREVHAGRPVPDGLANSSCHPRAPLSGIHNFSQLKAGFPLKNSAGMTFRECIMPGTGTADQCDDSILRLSSVTTGFAPSGCTDSSVWKDNCPRSSLSFGASSITCQFLPSVLASGCEDSRGARADCAESKVAHEQRRKKLKEQIRVRVNCKINL